MKKQIQIAKIVFGLLTLTFFLGCADKPSFQFNVVAKKEAENGTPFSAEQSQDVANILTALFGTPDDPAMPNANSFHWYLQYDEGYAEDFATLVDFENLKRSAGPVSSDENGDSRGLYREHCAHCHGISGGGGGPTALTLNPYPRDFRHGVYKFKSTSGKARPTDDDLMHIINEGIPGTSMPSFKVAINDNEKKALVDYVKYLSLRGEIERLLWTMTSELETGERLPLVFADGYDKLSEEEKDNLMGWFEEEGAKVESLFKSWLKAKTSPNVKQPPTAPKSFDPKHPDHSTLIAQGREIFHGKAGDCKSCHGFTGYGDGELNNYDVWNQWAKGKSDDYIAEFVNDGALPPRTIAPRNFRNGVFRGGRDPNTLYRRIKEGIQGAQMPNAATLTDDQIWSLVAYVRNIKSEPITGGQSHLPVNDKPIN